MKKRFLLFPHQLFQSVGLLCQADEVVLVEEFLFFRQFQFHKQKLLLHRSSMQYYAHYLREAGIKVQYYASEAGEQRLADILKEWKHEADLEIHFYEVSDDWLNRDLHASGLRLVEHPNPQFLNTPDDLTVFFEGKKHFFQTDFYIRERKRLGILLDEKGKPLGGKWSFDSENRHKYPTGKTPPPILLPTEDSFYQEAKSYILRNFPHNPGNIPDQPLYAWTHAAAALHLEHFLTYRLHDFGTYEDAIVPGESVLHHSVLSPLLNIGLLTPQQVLSQTLDFANEHEIPLNSLEGFIRQLIGWREFIRGVYLFSGRKERSRNFWQFTSKLPDAFYQGTTGILPFDDAVSKLKSTAYNHHIERLMILGNFMLLCEIAPDAVYRWFMELYIDAYDWVMVPNVYGMSQFADGGLMSTKPYLSGSNYLLKMSHYPKSPWTHSWDALFWEFMHRHRDFFGSNPRLGMLLKTYDRMDSMKKEAFRNERSRLYKSLGLT